MQQRLAWLDWQRGLAVLVMIEVHVLNAWTAPAAAHGALFAVLQMAGGFAAPAFLFMAGVSQVLGDASLVRRGISPRARLRAHLMRGGYVLGVAYAFRLFEFLSGWAFLVPGGWRTLFKVDVLNIIGLVLLVGAPLVALLTPRVHVVASLFLVALIVLATPLVADPSCGFTCYSFVQSDHGFGFFNWSAFLLAGGAVGRLVAFGARRAHLFGLGTALMALSGLVYLLPAYHLEADVWGTSPAWFLTRLGSAVLMAGALQYVPAPFARVLSPLSLFGRHSLLVYMASVEFTYGLWLKRLHGQLELSWALLGIVGMTAAMWLACRGLELWARSAAPERAQASA